MKQGVQWVGRLNARNRPKVKTPEDAYAHLFDAIVDQRLMPGTKLSELSLVETFGIGRRSINAVLQRLAWEHLVVIFPNRGAFVAAPTPTRCANLRRAHRHRGRHHPRRGQPGDPIDIAKLAQNIAEEHECREQGRLREAIRLSGGIPPPDGGPVRQQGALRPGAPSRGADQPGHQPVREPGRTRRLA